MNLRSSLSRLGPALAIAACAALPLHAQVSACASLSSFPQGGNFTCTIGNYTAQFSSGTGSFTIGQGPPTITLTGGWVWMTPNGNPSPAGTTAPVVVKTTYATSGVSSTYPDTTGTIVFAGGTSKPTFLVVAYARYTALALVSGTLNAPSTLTPGCEIQYTSQGPSAPMTFEWGVTVILQQLGIPLPTSPSC